MLWMLGDTHCPDGHSLQLSVRFLHRSAHGAECLPDPFAHSAPRPQGKSWKMVRPCRVVLRVAPNRSHTQVTSRPFPPRPPTAATRGGWKHSVQAGVLVLGSLVASDGASFSPVVLLPDEIFGISAESGYRRRDWHGGWRPVLALTCGFWGQFWLAVGSHAATILVAPAEW